MDKEHEAIEKASYVEWASFVSSVKGTLENFTFEYCGEPLDDMDLMNNGSYFSSGPFRNMGEISDGWSFQLLSRASGLAWPL